MTPCIYEYFENTIKHQMCVFSVQERDPGLSFSYAKQAAVGDDDVICNQEFQKRGCLSLPGCRLVGHCHYASFSDQLSPRPGTGRPGEAGEARAQAHRLLPEASATASLPLALPGDTVFHAVYCSQN